MTLDDLTIFLKAVDQTRRATQSAKKNLFTVKGAADITRKALKGLGATAVTAFTAAVTNGATLTSELSSMSRQLDITFRDAQQLFNSVREADASTNLDNLTEALLTVKERFADAQVGAGPLLGLMRDFEGFELDLGVDNAADQLANFLEQVAELPNANAKIFALKEVIGDEDARPFFNIINNTEKLNELLRDLRGNVEDAEGVLSSWRVEGIEEAKQASAGLAKEWDDFSIKAYAFVAPALALINNGLAGLVSLAGGAIDGIERIQNAFRKLIGTYVDPVGIQLTDSASERIAKLESEADQAAQRVIDGINKINTSAENASLIPDSAQKLIDGINSAENVSLTPDSAPSGIVKNEFGTFKNIDEFNAWLKAQRSEINNLIRQSAANPIDLTETRTDPAFVTPDGSGDPANDAVFNGPGGPIRTLDSLQNDIAQNNAAAFGSPIEDSALSATEAVSGLGSAFGSLGDAIEKFGQASGRSNERTFRNFQRFQVAMSTAAAVSAAIQAAADLPPGSGFARVAAYASVLGTLLAGVAQLRSLSVGSSSVSASGDTGGSTLSGPSGVAQQAPAAANQPQRNLTINIQGNAGISPEQVEDLIREINDLDSGLQINSNRIAS